MKSLAAFVAEHLEHTIDGDHVFGAQCMDLAEAYAAEVLDFPPLTGNAVDVWTLRQRPGYLRIPNAPHNFPEPGDVVVWGGPSRAVGTSRFGHIAVALLADSMHLLSFDQNWPEGSPCHVQLHSYTAVLGWLHPLRYSGSTVTALS